MMQSTKEQSDAARCWMTDQDWQDFGDGYVPADKAYVPFFQLPTAQEVDIMRKLSILGLAENTEAAFKALKMNGLASGSLCADSEFGTYLSGRAQMLAEQLRILAVGLPLALFLTFEDFLTCA